MSTSRNAWAKGAMEARAIIEYAESIGAARVRRAQRAWPGHNTGDQAMNEREEQAFIRGGQAALRAMLGHALRELLSMGIPDDDKDVQIARLASELSDATATLRRVCAEHGDNDWPDDLSLPDVIEKHLARHLRDSKENAGTEPDEGARGRKRVGKTIIPTTLYNAIADMLGATDARDDTPELEALREVFVGCAAA